MRAEWRSIYLNTLRWSKQESFSNHRGGKPTKVSEFPILTQRQEWTLEMSSVKAPTLWWGQWGESECDHQRSVQGGGGRHLCSLCHQDGGSLFQCNSGQLHDQVCCQTPHLRGVCPALATEGGSKLPKEERNLSKEGLEDEEGRDSHAPEGLPF